jgi:MFS transporter, DHA1 family, multidrug resistance protein
MSSRNMASPMAPTQSATGEGVISASGMTTSPGADVEQQTTPMRALPLLILGGLSALGPLSTDMYLPALPALGQELGATMTQTQLTLTAGILGLALGQVIAGPSSDAWGRRRPLLIGLAAFALSSLLGVMAPSAGVLTMLRFVQGVTGAAGIVIALAVVSDLYRGVAQARLYAQLTQVSGLAPIIAPVIGSQLLTFTSWRGIFVALALMGLLLWVGAALGLRETLPVERRQRGGIVATLHSLRILLGDRRYIGFALSSGFAFAAGIVYISSSPFILLNLYGVTPQFMGGVFAVNALGLVLMAQASSRLVGRVSPHTLLGWGVATIAVGGVSLLVVALSGIGLAGLLIALFVIVSSLGLIAPNATALALGNTVTAGSAAALLGLLQFSVGALVAPLVGIAGAESAVPMAVTIAGFGLATLVTFNWLGRSERRSSEIH